MNDTFKRLSKFSNIDIFIDILGFKEWAKFYKDKGINPVIIQMLFLENQGQVIIEFINENLIEKYREEIKTATVSEKAGEAPKKSEEQKELENDLETVLNNDPFSKDKKHSGKTLKEIFECDLEWVEYAIKHMNNEFIKNKLINIKRNWDKWQ